MQRSDLNLKWLEVFQLAAKSGSIQAVAKDMNLAISTVSQHLTNLENQLGVSLLDHKRRPMVLTPQGKVFLKYINEALLLIRKAQSEVILGDIAETRQLRLGLIEDFENDVGPELASELAAVMPKCDFIHKTRFSHEILSMLKNRELDIGIANRPVDDVSELKEYPLLRDPFVLAVPAKSTIPAEKYLSEESNIPFLRYSHQHIIGTQIEAQLLRLKINLSYRFEVESNQTMMGMIAANNGWSITTPLCYLRANQRHGDVKLLKFPAQSFSRNLSIFTSSECPESIAESVNATLRRLIQKHTLSTTYKNIPWIEDSFHLL